VTQTTPELDEQGRPKTIWGFPVVYDVDMGEIDLSKAIWFGTASHTNRPMHTPTNEGSKIEHGDV
jgi:hypothetical protein